MNPKKKPLNVVEIVALIIETKDDPSTPPKVRRALTRSLAATRHDLPASVRDQVFTAAQNLAAANAATRLASARKAGAK